MNWWFIAGGILALIFLALSKQGFYAVMGLIFFGLFVGYKYIVWRAGREQN